MQQWGHLGKRQELRSPKSLKSSSPFHKPADSSLLECPFPTHNKQETLDMSHQQVPWGNTYLAQPPETEFWELLQVSSGWMGKGLAWAGLQFADRQGSLGRDSPETFHFLVLASSPVLSVICLTRCLSFQCLLFQGPRVRKQMGLRCVEGSTKRRIYGVLRWEDR